MAEKDSMLDGFMKGLGRKLGTRRRDVHQAIRRFNEELHKDEELHKEGSSAYPQKNDAVPAPSPTTASDPQVDDNDNKSPA